MWRILVGPYSSLLLADPGATVIVIEDPKHEDDQSKWALPKTSDGNDTYIESVIRYTHAIALGFEKTTDLRHGHRLTSEVDVVTQHFKVGVLERFAKDLENVNTAN